MSKIVLEIKKGNELLRVHKNEDGGTFLTFGAYIDDKKQNMYEMDLSEKETKDLSSVLINITD